MSFQTLSGLNPDAEPFVPFSQPVHCWAGPAPAAAAVVYPSPVDPQVRVVSGGCLQDPYAPLIMYGPAPRGNNNTPMFPPPSNSLTTRPLSVAIDVALPPDMTVSFPNRSPSDNINSTNNNLLTNIHLSCCPNPAMTMTSSALVLPPLDKSSATVERSRPPPETLPPPPPPSSFKSTRSSRAAADFDYDWRSSDQGKLPPKPPAHRPSLQKIEEDGAGKGGRPSSCSSFVVSSSVPKLGSLNPSLQSPGSASGSNNRRPGAYPLRTASPSHIVRGTSNRIWRRDRRSSSDVINEAPRYPRPRNGRGRGRGPSSMNKQHSGPLPDAPQQSNDLRAALAPKVEEVHDPSLGPPPISFRNPTAATWRNFRKRAVDKVGPVTEEVPASAESRVLDIPSEADFTSTTEPAQKVVFHPSIQRPLPRRFQKSSTLAADAPENIIPSFANPVHFSRDIKPIGPSVESALVTPFLEPPPPQQPILRKTDPVVVEFPASALNLRREDRYKVCSSFSSQLPPSERSVAIPRSRVAAPRLPESDGLSEIVRTIADAPSSSPEATSGMPVEDIQQEATIPPCGAGPTEPLVSTLPSVMIAPSPEEAHPPVLEVDPLLFRSATPSESLAAREVHDSVLDLDKVSPPPPTVGRHSTAPQRQSTPPPLRVESSKREDVVPESAAAPLLPEPLSGKLPTIQPVPKRRTKFSGLAGLWASHQSNHPSSAPFEMPKARPKANVSHEETGASKRDEERAKEERLECVVTSIKSVSDDCVVVEEQTSAQVCKDDDASTPVCKDDTFTTPLSHSGFAAVLSSKAVDELEIVAVVAETEPPAVESMSLTTKVEEESVREIEPLTVVEPLTNQPGDEALEEQPPGPEETTPCSGVALPQTLADETPALIPQEVPSTSEVVVTDGSHNNEKKNVVVGLPNFTVPDSLSLFRTLGVLSVGQLNSDSLLAALDEESTALNSPREIAEPLKPPKDNDVASGTTASGMPADAKWPSPLRSVETGRIIWRVESLLMVRHYPSCSVRPDLPNMEEIMLPPGAARRTVQYLSTFGGRGPSGCSRQMKNYADVFWDPRRATQELSSILLKGPPGKRASEAGALAANRPNAASAGGGKETPSTTELDAGSNNWRAAGVHAQPKPSIDIDIPQDAWTVQQRKEKQEGDELKTTARKLRGLLNKMTADRFDALYQKMLEVVTRHEEVMELIGLIFEKATTQHTYVKMYADLTVLLDRDLTLRGIVGVKCVDGDDKQGDFRHIILKACQTSFETTLRSRFEPPEDASEEEKFEELLKYKLRMKGNLKLVGELLMRGMMAPKVGFSIMEELITSTDENQLEALASFMATVGHFFETNKLLKQRITQTYHTFLERIGELACRDTVPVRIQCLLKDVLEGRHADLEIHQTDASKTTSHRW